tara:strand:+ start:883 stop:1734 length:852 start_codon:yes stop_codon:yes gene_type:complete
MAGMSTLYDLEILSLGAGIQSTALYLMALNGEFEKTPSAAIFADTQWEPKEVYEHVEKLQQFGGDQIPIYTVTHGNLRQDTLDVIEGKKKRLSNPPFFVKDDNIRPNMAPDRGGMIWRQCTKDYKILPVQKKMRELLGYKPRQRVKKTARNWIGISVDEASRMKDSRDKWIENYYPLVERRLSRNDCVGYLRDNGFESTTKSACIGCPYHSNKTWVDMKKNKPDQWLDAVDFDTRLRQGSLPGVTGKLYLSRHFEPLPQAVLQDYDENQIDMFEQECEGMCGV